MPTITYKCLTLALTPIFTEQSCLTRSVCWVSNLQVPPNSPSTLIRCLWSTSRPSRSKVPILVLLRSPEGSHHTKAQQILSFILQLFSSPRTQAQKVWTLFKSQLHLIQLRWHQNISPSQPGLLLLKFKLFRTAKLLSLSLGPTNIFISTQSILLHCRKKEPALKSRTRLPWVVDRSLTPCSSMLQMLLRPLQDT